MMAGIRTLWLVNQEAMSRTLPSKLLHLINLTRWKKAKSAGIRTLISSLSRSLKQLSLLNM